MRNYLTIAVIALIGLGFTTNATAQKYGYVNAAAILAELPEVKQAESNLEALQTQLQKKGRDRVEQFQKKYADLSNKAQAGELSPVQQEQAAAELEKEQQEIANLEQDMVNQIQKKRNELLEPIYNRMNAAIEAVAKENGFTMIFDQTVLLYGDTTVDISEQVKAKLNQ